MHPVNERITRQAGVWLVSKARQQAALEGTHQAALALRLAGMPLSLALLILRRPV